MSQLPGEIDGRRFLRAMARLGWHVATVRGSHFTLVSAVNPRKVRVAFHATLSRHSVKRALEEAEVTLEEFLEAY